MKTSEILKKEINNKEKGITLISLAVTIILLLILTFVSVGVLTGDNGLIKQTKETMEKYEDTSKSEDNNIEIAKKYLDKINGTPDLKQGDIDYEIEPKDWTKEKVTIKLKSNVEGEYNLQYSFDRKKWEEYKEKIEVEKNITIYICLINSAGKQGSATSLKIANIDKIDPVEIEPEIVATSNSITIEAKGARDG